METKKNKELKRMKNKKTLCKQKNQEKTRIKAFSSQPIFRFFSKKSISRKMIFGQL